MILKRFLLINSMAFSLLGASVALAQASAHNEAAHKKNSHYCHPVGKMLTAQQRTEFQHIRKELRAQMIPLIKEKRALNMQIRGKIATPNVKWEDVAALVEKRNKLNEKISMVWSKTQFKTFQKLGIVLPAHKHHCHEHKKKLAQKNK